MRDESSDFHLVVKRMMYDFRLFNAEICDVDSDGEKEPSRSNDKKMSAVKDNCSS